MSNATIDYWMVYHIKYPSIHHSEAIVIPFIIGIYLISFGNSPHLPRPPSPLVLGLAASDPAARAPEGSAPCPTGRPCAADFTWEPWPI